MKPFDEKITTSEIYSPDFRKSARRAEDLENYKIINRYKSLFQVGQIITSEIDYDILFKVIIKETSRIMDVERCSIFLLDETGKMLDAIASIGVGGLTIKVPKDKGVVGWVFNKRKPAIVNDVNNDPRFFPMIDKKYKLETNNLMCVPLEKKGTKCLGVLEVINSKQSNFDDFDCETLIYLSNYITIALENARLYKKVKIMNHAKERAINHIAHELTTPISILSSVIKRLSKALKKYDVEKSVKIENMGFRNIKRILDLQAKATDIIRYGPAGEIEFIESLVSNAANTVEGIIKEENPENNVILQKILDRIKSIYSLGEIHPEKIKIISLIEDIIREVNLNIGNRDVRIKINAPSDLILHTDKMALRRVLLGLIKNAVENTPDEGYIHINAYKEGKHVLIDCIDNGIGISAESKNQIFSGFYHTQKTDRYSTKKPFAFNAGGSGIDLLRARILSQKLRFELDFSSNRCRYILLGNYQCPGKISNCKFIKENWQCHQSGGSTFSCKFKVKP